MKFKFYQIYDKITKKFTMPQLSDNRGRFVANFVLNRMEQDKSFKIEEYELIEAGEYDTETGLFLGKEQNDTFYSFSLKEEFEIWQNKVV